MIKSIVKFYEKHKRIIKPLFGLLVVIFAFVGSYQYYADYASGVAENRFWSAVIFSTFRLYGFSPTVGPGNATPFLYELAKWMAPVCTIYVLFRVIESFFRHHISHVWRVFVIRNKKQQIIFGHNALSEVLIDNLLESKEKSTTVVLITEEELDKEKALVWEREGLVIYRIKADEKPSVEELKWIRPELASQIVLFHEDSTMNFSVLQELVNYFSRNRNEKEAAKLEEMALYCEEPFIKKIISGYCKDNANITWGISCFSLPELAAYALFDEHPLYKNCLDVAVEGLEKPMTAEEILQKIPQPHVLIAGFGHYGQAVLDKVLLTGCLSDRSKCKNYKKLRVTIIDKQGAMCKDIVRSKYPMIHKICDMTYLDSDMESWKIERELYKLPSVTYVVLSFADQILGISGLEKLREYLSIVDIYKDESSQVQKGYPRVVKNIPIAVRMKQDGSVIKYEKQNKSEGISIEMFGVNKEILTEKNVWRHELEEKAMNFHYAYARSQSGSENVAEKKKEWMELSYDKKESCRAQVLNLPYFSALIANISELPPKLAEASLQDTEKVLSWLKKSPSIDALAALEHQRWCNYCYCSGYIGKTQSGEEKDSIQIRICKKKNEIYCGKVHNCLHDSWEDLKEDSTVNGTIRYDVESIYKYKS